MKIWLIHRAWPLVSRTVQEWYEDDGGLLAASLSFYTAFSFFPLILVILAIFGFVLQFSQQAQQAQQGLLQFVAHQTSPDMVPQFESILSQVQAGANIGGWIGLGTLFFGAIGIFSSMDLAFSRIWKTRDQQDQHSGWLKTIQRVLFTRFKAFVVVLALGLFVSATFFSGIALTAISQYTEDVFPADRLWKSIQIGIGFSLNLLFFTLTYRLFSQGPIRWWECFKGGILAAVFWELGRFGLTLYLVRGGYSAYGVIGSFIAIMMWIYYAWTVLFFGAEYVQVSTRIHNERRVVQ